MAKYKLLKDDYAIIKSLKADCRFYMNKYETIEAVQDKFREIYQISREIKNISDSDEAIKQEIEKGRIKKENIKNLIRYADTLCKKFQCKLGLSYDNFMAQNEVLRNSNLKRGDENNNISGMPLFYFFVENLYSRKERKKDFVISAAVNKDNAVVMYSVSTGPTNKPYEYCLSIYNYFKKALNQYDKKYIIEGKEVFGWQRIIVRVPNSTEDTSINFYIVLEYHQEYGTVAISFLNNEKLVDGYLQ
ncbi:hypothetical protein ACFQZF_07735 [Flavobacterium myungsuense]